MNRLKIQFQNLFCLAGFLFSSMLMQAQLAVTVSSPKIVGQKAVVELKMKNNFPQKIESARAVCFLLDDQGKMVGQSTKWVVGGVKNQPALESNKETTYNFVINRSQSFDSTNLTAKISFTRMVLDGKKLVDPKASVQIQNVK